jgi:predicted metal-binding membrane protein
MQDMGSDMLMPGGWTMSMAWMQMPNQTLAGAAVSFLGMWVAMMAPMMLPSLVPSLIRYREAASTTEVKRMGWLTTLVGMGYFAVWTGIGMVVFAVGFALSMAEMQNANFSRAVPTIVGVLVLVVGALQLTAWKARRLACCRKTPASDRLVPANAATAWRHGLHLGINCGYCCFGLMLIVVVLGVMDLRLMAVVTVAITAERLAPNGHQVARAIGWLVVAAGLFLIARAVGVH